MRPRAKGVTLIAYGLGITPSMSILRSAAGRGDARTYVLFYANRTAADITSLTELEALRPRLDVQIIHVLSRPAEGWAGERGRITADLLHRRLPGDLSRWDFFLCGAGAPVDSGIEASPTSASHPSASTPSASSRSDRRVRDHLADRLVDHVDPHQALIDETAPR